MHASRGGVTTAALFEAIWSSLASVLGTPATATLWRRAIRGVADGKQELQALKGLAVVREELEYRYILPPAWQEEHDAESLRALKHLVEQQLVPLLTELTGPIGPRLLERLPELKQHGILGGQDEPQRFEKEDEPR